MSMMGNFFIQPFDFEYKKYQRYIHVAIEGNRVYREFYVITDTEIDGRIKIMLIAICQDGKVITYLNDKEDAAKLGERPKNMPVYYSPIKMLTNDSRSISYINIFLRTEKSEQIQMELHCLKKFYRKKRAIRRKNLIFTDSKSTIFYSSKILRSTGRSTISITGKEYDIKRKTIIPYLLSDVDLLYVQDLGIINIYNKEKTGKLISKPESIAVGEKFIYLINGEEENYVIEKIDGDNVYIAGAVNKIIAKKTENGLALFKIFVTLHPEAPEIVFYPPINMSIEDSSVISNHKASLTMGKSSVTGEVVYYGRGRKGFDLMYICDPLGWSEAMPLASSFVFDEEDNFRMLSGIRMNEHLVDDKGISNGGN